MARKTTATKRTKQMPCRGCGKGMTVGANTRKLPRCLECGIQEAIIATQQLRNHEGQHYVKWRNAMIALGERMQGATPTPSANKHSEDRA